MFVEDHKFTHPREAILLRRAPWTSRAHENEKKKWEIKLSDTSEKKAYIIRRYCHIFRLKTEDLMAFARSFFYAFLKLNHSSRTWVHSCIKHLRHVCRSLSKATTTKLPRISIVWINKWQATCKRKVFAAMDICRRTRVCTAQWDFPQLVFENILCAFVSGCLLLSSHRHTNKSPLRVAACGFGAIE